MQESVVRVITSIRDTIEEHQTRGSRLVSFDLTDCPPIVIGQVIIKTLRDKGYLAYVFLSAGASPRREVLYIDLERSKPSV